jgi:hypothetical protein
MVYVFPFETQLKNFEHSIKGGTNKFMEEKRAHGVEGESNSHKFQENYNSYYYRFPYVKE